MADIKGIELASDVYGLEDEKARGDIETNTSAIGTLANLTTFVKTNLVAAINELVEKINNLFGSSTPIVISPGIIFKKVGNTVFVNIQSTSVYWLNSGTYLRDGDGVVIEVPENLRPKRDVNVFIAHNTKDTLYRLRLNSSGNFVSWDLRYNEQTFALPIGPENSNWQTFFSYQLDFV